jgi:hypothetical protein
LVKKTKNVRLELVELKSIPIWDSFFRIALDIIGPFPKTKHSNRYGLVAIDHYSKWCEVKAVMNHDAKIATKFLESEVICRFGVPKYISIDNGIE